MTWSLLKPCRTPIFGAVPAEMRPEEAEALDVLCHLIKPELVVETGCYFGGSALLFARHARVITIDVTFRRVRDGLFDGLDITPFQGASPGCLREVEIPSGVKRWLFFHDSVHWGSILYQEVLWAFEKGAVAACWHDVALVDDPGDTMLSGLERLQKEGVTAMRLQHFGEDFTTMHHAPPTIWSGIGLAWNPAR